MLSLSQHHGILIPHLKTTNADLTDSTNYRPISNLTFTSKLVERLICLQLVVLLEREGHISIYQSANRKHHSTETVVLKIVSDALLAADHGDMTLLILLNLSAAFDTIDYNILIDCLH